MFRRLIASSLIAVSCLSVFVPLALAAQRDPMPMCCRRGANHHCTGCGMVSRAIVAPSFAMVPALVPAILR